MNLFLFSRKQLQVLEKHVMDSKRMAERVIKSGKRTIDEIHILIQNHIISMQRREHELISKAEKIQQVINCLFRDSTLCRFRLPQGTGDVKTAYGAHYYVFPFSDEMSGFTKPN